MNWLKLERLLGPNSQLSDNIFHMKLDNQMVDTYRVNNVQFETKMMQPFSCISPCLFVFKKNYNYTKLLTIKEISSHDSLRSR